MKIFNLCCSMLAVVAVIFLPRAYAANAIQLTVNNAWVQAMPPSQTTTAAYMTITNNSSQQEILTSASSDIAGAVELHQMGQTNGMMNMAPVASINVPAQGKVDLQPGGYHIMLINLKRPVNQGEIVPITLHFKDGSVIMVNAEVKMQEQQSSSSMPGMNM